MSRNKSVLVHNFIFVIFFMINFSCDFSSRTHKRIIIAQEKIQNRQYEEAVQLYENLLKLKLTENLEIRIRFQLADLYTIYLRNYKKAEKHLKILNNEKFPISVRISSLKKMGELYFEHLSFYKESYEVYHYLTTIRPKLSEYDDLSFFKAKSLMKINLNEAKKLFEKIVKDEKSTRKNDSLNEMAHINYLQKNWNEAIGLWKEYLKFENDKMNVVTAKFMIASAYENQEMLKDAYSFYYSIIGDYPNQEVIKKKIDSLYNRRVSRKR